MTDYAELKRTIDGYMAECTDGLEFYNLYGRFPEPGEVARIQEFNRTMRDEWSRATWWQRLVFRYRLWRYGGRR